MHAIRASDGELLWRAALPRASYGAPSFVNGLVLVPVTFGLQLMVLDADDGNLLWTVPLPGAPSSTPVPVGDSIYLGIGTRETDAEYKAFGGSVIEPIAGAHPLSPLSGILALETP